MFIDGTPYISRKGPKGSFLLLFSSPRDLPQNKMSMPPIYACVRRTNAYTGTVRLGGKSIIINGTYGNNGQPISLYRVELIDSDRKSKSIALPKNLFKYLMKLPDNISTLIWREIDGNVEIGTAGPVVREWARNHYHELRPR